ncbi:MAG TPA: chemotaxis protein CheW, partial [Nitrospiraceae bacterium]|nr:chemotaxis protein CheW [Nitrospiraceae bacterium]
MSLRTQTDTGQTTTVSSATSFLLVVCGETYLALPAGLIRGIIKWDDADKAAALERLAARTRVMDLAERLGLPSISSSEARILVCGGNSVCRAFLVTAIVGLEDIESAMITPLLPHFTGLERQWFSGMFLFREAVALVL